MAISSPPFFNTGVDFFGPITSKFYEAELKDGTAYLRLTTRAVHLEVCETLETDTFISRLERFVKRRGYLTVITSDSGTNFKGAERELKEVLKQLNHTKIE